MITKNTMSYICVLCIIIIIIINNDNNNNNRWQPFLSGDDGVALCRCGASSRVAIECHSGVAVSVANDADEGGWCCN